MKNNIPDPWDTNDIETEEDESFLNGTDIYFAEWGLFTVGKLGIHFWSLLDGRLGLTLDKNSSISIERKLDKKGKHK